MGSSGANLEGLSVVAKPRLTTLGHSFQSDITHLSRMTLGDFFDAGPDRSGHGGLAKK